MAGGDVDQDIGRLDVPVYEAALVKLAESRCNRDGEAQKVPHFHRRAEQPVERFAARILEHQHGPSGIADEVQRPRRPRPVELVLQFEFMGKTIEACAGRVIAGGSNGQHGVLLAVIIQSPAAAEDAFAVLPQDLRGALRVRAVKAMRHHLPAPASGCCIDFGRPGSVFSSNLSLFAGLYSRWKWMPIK